MRPRPPGWARTLLRCVVPEAHADAVAGDLEEGFLRRAITSPSAARRWYVRQVLASVVPSLLHRHRLRRARRRHESPSMEILLRTMRFALRSLVKSPTFSVVAILTLTLAIGVNTAMFSILSVIIFADLPMQDTETVAVIRGVNPELGVDRGDLSIPAFMDLRDRATSFEDLAALTSDRWILTGGEAPVRVRGMRVTANNFDVWHLPPILGRSFSVGEDAPGAARVAMISYPFWQARFAGSPAVLGSTLELDGEAYPIVGVVNPKMDFADFSRAQVFVPLALDRSASRDTRNLFVSGRLKEGVSQARAAEEVAAIGRALVAEHPEVAGGWSLWSAPALEALLGDDSRTLLLMLTLTVTFVILIACANVANMLLARATVRARELSVHAALGAGRGRLVGKLLIESFMISLVSAALGVGFARLFLDALVRIANGTEDVFNMARLDGRVLAFTVLAATATPFVFGLLPALRAASGGATGVLREGRSTGGARTGRRTRNVLAGAQVTLALCLMVVAGLLTRTVMNIALRDPGIDPRGIIAVDLDVPVEGYPDAGARIQFYEAAREAIAALPTVAGTALTDVIPFAGFGEFRGIRVEGREAPPNGGLPTVEIVTVSPDFGAMVKLPLVRGRALAVGDGPDAPKVALVSRRVAELHWPGEEAIGRRFQLGGGGADPPWIEVVGVVEDVAPSTDTEAPPPYVYLSHAQYARAAMSILVRTDADPAIIAGSLRQAIGSVDSDQPVDRIRTLEHAMHDFHASSWAVLTLFVTFAALALVMASVGIYGVMSYSVSQRKGEMGLRMALGARAETVRGMVLGQGMRVVMGGMVVGLLFAWGLARALAGVLVGVSPTDPVTFLVVSGTLGAVALLATWVPAVHATHAEPATVLRME